MITELRITDLGVINDAVLPLHPGLTVVTGETGAGKTMIVTSIDLLLGGRTDAKAVRSGARRAVVEGRFAEVADDTVRRVQEAGASWMARGVETMTPSCWSPGRSPRTVVRVRSSAEPRSRWAGSRS